MTIPDYYPLSLNALVNGCNQKSNREPVVTYDEETVLKALEGLKGKELVWQSDLSRVAKYSHNFLKARNLVNKEAAILCVLFLRGPQTAGEIRERTERLYRFNTIEHPGREMTTHTVSPAHDIYAEDERIKTLGEELTRLRQELEELRQEFQEFKSQF